MGVGLLAADPAFTVTVGRVADQSVNDRANRIFPALSFEATLAGAIHNLRIRGTIRI